LPESYIIRNNKKSNSSNHSPKVCATTETGSQASDLLYKVFEQKTYIGEKGLTFYKYIIKKDEITYLKTAITYYNNQPNTPDVTYQEFTDLLDKNLRPFTEKRKDISKTDAFKFAEWGSQDADLVNAGNGKDSIYTGISNYTYSVWGINAQKTDIPRSEWNRLHPEGQR